MNGDGSKTPTAPPLPLRGTSPKGGSEGLCEFASDFLNGILRTANPSATLTRGPPQPCIKQLYAVEDGYTC